MWSNVDSKNSGLCPFLKKKIVEYKLSQVAKTPKFPEKITGHNLSVLGGSCCYIT